MLEKDGTRLNCYCWPMYIQAQLASRINDKGVVSVWNTREMRISTPCMWTGGAKVISMLCRSNNERWTMHPGWCLNHWEACWCGNRYKVHVVPNTVIKTKHQTRCADGTLGKPQCRGWMTGQDLLLSSQVMELSGSACSTTKHQARYVDQRGDHR